MSNEYEVFIFKYMYAPFYAIPTWSLRIKIFFDAYFEFGY